MTPKEDDNRDGSGGGGGGGGSSTKGRGVGIAMEDVERALRLKSFDYRVMNLLLHASVGRIRLEQKEAERRRRRDREQHNPRRSSGGGDSGGTGADGGRVCDGDDGGGVGGGGEAGRDDDDDVDDIEEMNEVNETHASFLATSEVLVELSDDLYDYEEDVATGAFNVYRCLVATEGPTRAAPRMATMIRAAEEDYQRAMRQLEPELAARYRERCRQATRAGAVDGDGDGDKGREEAPDGRWQVPAPIADETAYRCMVNGGVNM